MIFYKERLWVKNSQGWKFFQFSTNFNIFKSVLIKIKRPVSKYAIYLGIVLYSVQRCSAKYEKNSSLDNPHSFGVGVLAD